MEIGANAFNILTIWRDRKQEAAMEAAKTEEEKIVLSEKPGVILNIAKQRNGNFEGRVGLWFEMRTYQYSSDNRPCARNYMSHMENLSVHTADTN